MMRKHHYNLCSSQRKDKFAFVIDFSIYTVNAQANINSYQNLWQEAILFTIKVLKLILSCFTFILNQIYPAVYNISYQVSTVAISLLFQQK